MRRVAILAATARELAPAQSVCGRFGRIRRSRIGKFIHDIGRFDDTELHLIKTGIGRCRDDTIPIGMTFTKAGHDLTQQVNFADTHAVKPGNRMTG